MLKNRLDNGKVTPCVTIQGYAASCTTEPTSQKRTYIHKNEWRQGGMEGSRGAGADGRNGSKGADGWKAALRRWLHGGMETQAAPYGE